MKYTIDTDVLQKHGLSLSDFALLLFYAEGKQSTDIDATNINLWNMDYLVKDVYGFYIEQHKFDNLHNIMAESSLDKNDNSRADNLAHILREIFPKGYKDIGLGKKYSWRDSDRIIAGKLKTFFKRYGTQYTDEQIIEATKKYVKSFNGDYTYMKLLKYFIWKDDRRADANGEGYIDESSELVNMLENEDEVTTNSSWTNELK